MALVVPSTESELVFCAGLQIVYSVVLIEELVTSFVPNDITPRRNYFKQLDFVGEDGRAARPRVVRAFQSIPTQGN
jgi:hypothetical protein